MGASLLAFTLLLADGERVESVPPAVFEAAQAGSCDEAKAFCVTQGWERFEAFPAGFCVHHLSRCEAEELLVPRFAKLRGDLGDHLLRELLISGSQVAASVEVSPRNARHALALAAHGYCRTTTCAQMASELCGRSACPQLSQLQALAAGLSLEGARPFRALPVAEQCALAHRVVRTFLHAETTLGVLQSFRADLRSKARVGVRIAAADSIYAVPDEPSRLEDCAGGGPEFLHLTSSAEQPVLSIWLAKQDDGTWVAAIPLGQCVQRTPAWERIRGKCTVANGNPFLRMYFSLASTGHEKVEAWLEQGRIRDLTVAPGTRNGLRLRLD